MELLYKFPENRLQNIAITVGTFDGLHLGHKKIINQLRKISRKKNLKTAVISFKNPPRFFFNPQKTGLLLTTVEEKIELFKETGIDYLILLDFDNFIANLSPKDFVEKIILKIFDVKYYIVGYNHRFGKQQKGDLRLLEFLGKEYGFNVVEIMPLYINNESVSSSAIRHKLIFGDMEKANLFLGYRYFLTGKVVKGNKLGQKIGFPTANLNLDKNKLLPATGVYASISVVGEAMYWSMTNIGYKPTINSASKQKTLETHIFNFDKNIYGEKIKVKLIKKIRDERNFENIEHLAEQLKIDKQTVRDILIEKI